MASKRTHNVRSRIYSFSEESAMSDEEVQPKRRKLQINSSHSRIYSSNPLKLNRSLSTRTISSSCEENVHNGNMNKGSETLQKEFFGAKKQTCFSRNAVLARENRIKKKLYIDGLENQITSLKDENKKMRISLGTQASYITDLETEMSYLKSILANTKEIGLLLNSVRTNTGLPIRTTLQLSRDSYSEHKESGIRRTVPIARKTAWPYDSEEPKDDCRIPTPPTSVSSMSPQSTCEVPPLSPFKVDVMSYFSDDDLPIALDDVGLSPFSKNDDLFGSQSLLSPISSEMSFKEEEIDLNENVFQDHNYTSKANTDMPDVTPKSVGVCLHISNKKVSLEFCAKCSERAASNWGAVDH